MALRKIHWDYDIREGRLGFAFGLGFKDYFFTQSDYLLPSKLT